MYGRKPKFYKNYDFDINPSNGSKSIFLKPLIDLNSLNRIPIQPITQY